MKRFSATPVPSPLATTTLMTLLLLLIGFFTSGCVSARIEPLALLQGESEAVVFGGRDHERVAGRYVSVAELPEILARATWVDQRVFHKGGVWLRFRGGREIFLPVGFEFFLERDVPGHFRIKESDRERFLTLVQQIRRPAA